MVKRESLIGYAQSFVSFLLDSAFGDKVRKVILFGSVARGDFRENSDVDLFVEVEGKYEAEVEKMLNLFLYSQAGKVWQLRGIKNEISLKIGLLKEWKLYREVISSGILLYGKYVEVPEKLNFYALFVLKNISQRRVSKQMRLWRELYGYKQKVKKKKYVKKGLIEELRGRKLAKGVFIVSMEERRKVLEVLRREKAGHEVYELWSDSF